MKSKSENCSCSFDLSGRCVHVWSLRNDAPGTAARKFEAFLSIEERQHASRFCSERLRDSFFVARGALRYLLGRYVDLCPAEVRFKDGPQGKPALIRDVGIKFNTTHSGDFVAFAFTAGCEVGIDLEKIRPLPDLMDIANRFFSTDEAVELDSLPPGRRESAFFRCWTRKEAYIKATGCGLSAPLDQFQVSLLPHEPAQLIQLARDANAAKAWTLDDLKLATDYEGALAYRDQPRPILLFPTINPTELLALP